MAKVFCSKCGKDLATHENWSVLMREIQLACINPNYEGDKEKLLLGYDNMPPPHKEDFNYREHYWAGFLAGLMEEKQ